MSRAILFCCIFLLFPLHSQAAFTVNVNFLDVTNNTGVGFDDPVLGLTRQQTFNSVFNYINTVIDESGSIDVDVLASETGGDGFLAAAGPYFSTGGGIQNGSAFTHITTSSDPFGNVPDMEVTFDFGYNWHNDLSLPAGGFDLFSVSLHEITHGLGFLSLLEPDGSSAITGGAFSTYDTFLERGTDTDMDGELDIVDNAGNFVGQASDLTSGDVFFVGPNAMAANGGNPVSVYAPGAFSGGSSISHINTPTVMNYQIAPGVIRRSYSDVEIGILQDIGYTLNLSAVPEPSSLLLLCCGTGIAVMLRRRREELV